MPSHPHFHSAHSQELPSGLFTFWCAICSPRPQSDGPVRSTSGKDTQVRVFALEERHRRDCGHHSGERRGFSEVETRDMSTVDGV